MDKLPTKTCMDCGETKPQSEFYAHPEMRDGHLNSCKACRQQYVKQHRLTNFAAYQKREMKRSKPPARRKSLRKSTDRWNKHPQGYRAHNIAHAAVRDGKLKRMCCQLCGAEKAHMHHPDYQEPLRVVWLCSKCHRRLHSLFPKQMSGHSKP